MANTIHSKVNKQKWLDWKTKHVAAPWLGEKFLKEFMPGVVDYDVAHGTHDEAVTLIEERYVEIT